MYDFAEGQAVRRCTQVDGRVTHRSVICVKRRTKTLAVLEDGTRFHNDIGTPFGNHGVDWWIEPIR